MLSQPTFACYNRRVEWGDVEYGERYDKYCSSCSNFAVYCRATKSKDEESQEQKDAFSNCCDEMCQRAYRAFLVAVLEEVDED